METYLGMTNREIITALLGKRILYYNAYLGIFEDFIIESISFDTIGGTTVKNNEFGNHTLFIPDDLVDVLIREKYCTKIIYGCRIEWLIK